MGNISKVVSAPEKILWDAAVGRFRSSLTGRFVGLEKAIPHLSYNIPARRFIDEAGHFVGGLSKVSPKKIEGFYGKGKTFNMKFVGINKPPSPVSVYDIQRGIAFYIDKDGKVGTTEVWLRKGVVQDIEEVKRNSIGAIARAMGYSREEGTKDAKTRFIGISYYTGRPK